MRFLVFSFLILISTKVYAVRNLPFAVEEGFLVHVTRYMMSDSTAIPGASTEEGLIDKTLVPEIRCTLHHAYHGMVPDEAMGVGAVIAGMPVSLPSRINETRKYAWLDRFSNFLEHTFGGQLNDVYNRSSRLRQRSNCCCT